MPNKYGRTVRGRLLEAAHTMSVLSHETGVSRQLKTGAVDWKFDSAGNKRGKLSGNLIINGAFPRDFTVLSGWIEMDNGDTGLHVSRNMPSSMNRDVFARDFLNVMTDTLALYEETLCVNGLSTIVAKAPVNQLVSLRIRNLASEEIVIT